MICSKTTNPRSIASATPTKRDLIGLIQADKPLPDERRFVLFEDKREVELVWNGKTAAVCNAVLPFQTLEHIDEPREQTRVQLEAPQGEFDLDFAERWTGNYIVEHEWQSFRTRKDRELELITAEHRYEKPGRYTIAVKVVDIFGNDTMTLVSVHVGE